MLPSGFPSLQPPSAPPQTHREERAQLPPFPRGDPATRLERAREYLRQSQQQIEQRHRAGVSGLSVCRLISESMDRLDIGLFEELAAELKPPPDICLVALGGYGRRELAPHSDLDLLLLRGPKARDEQLKPFALAFSTQLWDLKRVVGWSVRTAAECARAAADDHTIRTALLDCRFLAGQMTVFEGLSQQVLRELLTLKADAFIADKTAELKARREKFGDSIFLLEPHLKQGEGGLRDLEAALWIAQARFRTRGLQALLRQSILPASEVATLTAARDFLLRVRTELHLLRGRKEDRLTFDVQEPLARNLGYGLEGEQLPVERFMRDYYLAAKAIRRAADALIARCEETAASRPAPFPERRLPPFKVFRGKLTLEGSAELFQSAPATAVKLFRVAEEEQLPLYSWARDQVTDALPRLWEARAVPEVVAELKAIFTRPGTRGQSLFAMHELGVLGTLIPEFGRVTAHHQNDLYHVYTVDVHSLFAVKRLYGLREGDLADAPPGLSREMRELSDPLPLYLGMLLHDCGKGMGGDHSLRGEELAIALGERWGLSPRQREVLQFLVRQHLLMSHTAQRRDLSDPELIASFADSCGDLEKLTCLYLLTYADICSVGPKMWTEWKGQLLAELYQKARAALLGTAERGGGSRSTVRQQCLARWGRVLGPQRAEGLAAVMPDRYYLSASEGAATLHGLMLERSHSQPLVSAVRHQRSTGFSELSLATRDRPGLLALLSGVLSAHRISILRATIFSTTDGRALDIFEVQPSPGPWLERKRWRAARADLIKALTGESTLEQILERRRTTSLLTRAVPRVQSRVSIDNRASQGFTVIDVRAQDRVGLLFAIASALSREGVEISLAKIVTEGNRAFDSFYVTRAGLKISDPAQLDTLTRNLQLAVEAFITPPTGG